MPELYLSPTEHWECANRLSKMLMKSTMAENGALAKIYGYEIYLTDNAPSLNPDYWVADSLLTRLGV